MRGLRQLGHKAVGVCFWLLLALLWVLLFLQHKATGWAIAASAQTLLSIAAAVLATTLLWVRHNVGIHRRKGPRRGRTAVAPRTHVDRLGRRVTWAFPGGHRDSLTASHVLVEIDGNAKRYSPAMREGS